MSGEGEKPTKHEDPVAKPVEAGDKPAAAEGEKKKPTKDEIKKARQAARLAEEQARAKEKAEKLAAFAAIFGESPLIRSETHKTIKFTNISDLDESMEGETVRIRARVHTVRGKGKMGFIVLRQYQDSVQGVLQVKEGGIPKEMVTFASSIPAESIVDCGAKVMKAAEPITATTQSALELEVVTLHVVSKSLPVLPFQIEDAARKDSDEGVKVNSDTRLQTRWLDMRTPASNSIFRLQSRVNQYFREYCLDNDFVEIHSPKIIGAASEGGANVFKLDYFGKPAFLAQSPQLYKQMALQGDLQRVFEIAPVFRSENSNTHRHLTEFVGLDIEMAINEHYYEVLDVAESLFCFMFEKLHSHRKELEAIRAQHPFEDLVWRVSEEKIKELGIGIIEEDVPTTDKYGGRIRNRGLASLRLPYAKAVQLLNDSNPNTEEHLAPTDDINTENEKKLGRLVKERYGTDFYISDLFPSVARPFYTMPSPEDPRFTNSYDIFIRGEEISSGAQRIHDPELLLKRAKELNVDMAPLKDYVDAFRLGAWPHGGFGVGMERVVMLYLGLHNVRYVSLFPRDPQRVTP